MRAFHILIIEDNKSISFALKTFLRKQSFNNIDTTSNGFEALKLLISKQYDLIFLDNLMPVMSGLEFLRRCRAGSILDWTTVMMVTAAADRETINIIKNEGLKVDEFVIKPLDYKVVTAKIDRLLRSDRHSPQQQLVQFDKLSGAVDRGSFLSITTESHNNSAVIRMFGFFLSDDRKMVKDIPDNIIHMPEGSITLDLTNILMIDEFGLGMLLLINGVATMAGKQVSMILDEKTIGRKLTDLGLSQIIPVISASSVEEGHPG